MPKCGSATVEVVCLAGTTSQIQIETESTDSCSTPRPLATACHGHPTVRNMGLLLFSATRSTTHWAISRRRLATVAEKRRKTPQTAIEKIVQKYAVDLPDGKLVKAGD